MAYDEALATAEKVLTEGASLDELVRTRNDLRAIAPDSTLAARLEERIADLLSETQSRMVGQGTERTS
jgi:hypothetical protein